MKQSITRIGRLLCCLALVLSVVVLPAAGCGGNKSESKGPAGDTEKSDKVVSSKGKKWGGWRWKGKRDDCFFVVKNRCFNNKSDACKAAGCREPACTHDKSAPAKVSCPGS